MTKPFRLALGAAPDDSARTGRRIDPTSAISFSFDGRNYKGLAGDTLASALVANGIRLVGRSFKYHRPRGILGLGAEEPNGLVTLGTGDRLEPNVRCTQVELYDGLVARSQNRWPGLSFDIGAINNKFSRFLPSGFYYKTFKGPGRSGWMFYENFIRRSAGLGPAPTRPDPDGYEHFNVSCDVLVVGSGAAGISAARAAAATGARVIVADENAYFGGLADCMGGTIEDRAQLEWVNQEVGVLAQAENVHLLPRTTVAGHYDHNFVLMLERVADHDPALVEEGAPRHRLWRVRAKEIILASGALERPLTFANNDRPGIMLASAIRANIHRYGVVPGEVGVLFTNNDNAYQTALDLQDIGVSIARIVDVRADPSGLPVNLAKAAGMPLMFGSGVQDVVTEKRGQQIKGVKVGGLFGAGGVHASELVACDFVAVSGGWNPAVHLYSHIGGKPAFDAERQIFVPGPVQDHLSVVGAANGTFGLEEIVHEADQAGDVVARRALGKRPIRRPASKIPFAKGVAEDDWESIWLVPAPGAKKRPNKHFVDFQNDVTAADLQLAVQEGYRSVEHVKRYTTLGMATDQGKTSNINALGLLSDALGKTIPEVGTTTFRPPYTPVSFGAIAGLRSRNLFQPVRQTPVSNWQAKNGADYEPVGQWRRPFCYPLAGEDREVAINREVLAVRHRAGIIDLSTLGKIEVKGADAGKFLDLMYTNIISTLKENRCRYGLMMDDQGLLFDDGVIVRLGIDRFLLHTTSGNADRTAGWLELWLQTEWPDLKVFVTPVTEQWAQFAVGGPHARDVLKKLRGTIKWGADVFPPLTAQFGKLLGAEVRVYRISYSGELSFEIATPANNGRALWDAILEAGEEYGIAPYGTEALHVLRAEKGFIAIGDETDGTVTPLDLGLGWAVSKKKADFVGKRSLERSFMVPGPHRKQLVGVFTHDPAEVLPIGCQALDTDQIQPPPPMLGHISSSYWSPTLDRSIALALIKNGQNRIGDTMYFPVGNKVLSGTLVDPIFYDREGLRQNG